MSHRFCQWCKTLLNPEVQNVEYGGKVYHERCFGDLVKVAHKTRSAL